MKEIIKNIAPEDVINYEKHLINQYLTNNNIEIHKSSILKDYMSDFTESSRIYSEVNTLSFETIKDLESYLELLIPQEDRKLNGAFFTPDYVVNYIINEVQPKINDKCIDPSCGSGAFLIGLTSFFKKTYNKKIKEIVKENIFGSDILHYNISRAKILLSIYALENNEILLDSDFNLYHQDSLKAKWDIKFDIVVGNPPYVKYQDLSNENREFLAQKWSTANNGAYNLFFAFFELGHNLLNSCGRLGYITPNNYFTSLAGESLRNFFHHKKCITKIIDFKHKKVFDVQTYTAITFISKQQNDKISYDRIDNNETPQDFLLSTNGSINLIHNLNPKKWRLLKEDEQYNIKSIETIGTPINELFDISVGVATLKDNVFFIEGDRVHNNNYIKTSDKGTFEIEKDITKPVYKISEFKSQKEINLNTKRIIFPYYINGRTATPIPEEELKMRYPKCYEYLLSEKETLTSRDKGKVKYNPFYVWGRTQGLTKRGKKLLTPTFSMQPRFLIVNEEESFYTNGYGIYFKENISKDLFSQSNNIISNVENIDILQKILNSIVMHYYVTTTSVSIDGGYPCYQKNFIAKFTIPEFSKDEVDYLRQLNDKHLIDEFLILKYQLKQFSGNLS